MKKHPEISIIVPVYNVERYLKRCLDSIAGQTFSDFEAVIVDDGSSDSSGLICDNYAEQDNRFVVLHKTNGGLSSARNAGIEAASGKYVCFIDSDDWVDCNMLKSMHFLMQEHSADIVSVSYALAKKENAKLNNCEESRVFNKIDALKYYLTQGMVNRKNDYPVWIKLYKKSLFSEIRFPVNKIYEDMATNIKLICLSTTYVKSKQELYYYFQGGRSIVRSPYKKRDEALIEVSNEMFELTKGYGNDFVLLGKEKIARSYLSLMLKIIIYGFDKSISKKERKQICKEYSIKIRLNRKILLYSGMPISRKLLLVFICLDYRLLLPLRILSFGGKK